MPDAEEEAASEAALRHGSDRRAVGADCSHDPGRPGPRTATQGDVARVDRRDPLFPAGGRRMEAAAA